MRKLIPINFVGLGLVIASIWILIYVSLVYWWPFAIIGIFCIFTKGKSKNVPKNIM